jgi:hypothetical protein
MDTSNLQAMSYNISCDHITKLKDKYNKLNEAAFKQHFNCIETDKNDNYRNMRYLNSFYISKKGCIFTSTEPDQLEWTKVFDDRSSPLGYKDDNAIVKFNENTRRKIISR